MANPFYIPVQNQVTPALQNLTQTLTGIGSMRDEQRRYDTEQAAKQAKQEELESATAEFQTAMTNKDYEAIANLGIRYPQMSESALGMMKFQDERTKNNLLDSGFDILRDSSPENIERVLTERTNLVTELGGDPSDTQAFIEQAKENPEAFVDGVNKFLASADSTRYKNYRDLMKEDETKWEIRETPTGFVRIDPQTGDHKEIKIGSKEAGVAQKEADDRLEAEVKASGTKFDQAKKLRDEFEKKSKDFYKVEDAFGRIESSVGEPDEKGLYAGTTAAGDLSLVFNYMKMLDPGSVVRESEFATAEKTRGVPDMVWAARDKITAGKRLTPKQRKEFVDLARGLMTTAKKTNEGRRGGIIRVGKRYGIEEQDIFGAPIKSDISDDDLVNKYL